MLARLHIAAMAAALCFLFLIPTRSEAQVAMAVKVVQNNFIQYESVFVRVAFRNLSAHPLAFGESAGLKGSLTFEIVQADRKEPSFARTLKDMPQPDMTGVILPPGGERTIMFNLSKHYDLRAIGKYSVKAVLRHPQLEVPYQSKEAHFTIVRGTLIWSRTVGLPLLDDSVLDKKDVKDGTAETTDDAVRKIKTREYRILSYNTGKSNVYCLTLEDKSNLYMLRHIGYDLGADLRPKCEIDFLSRLNILLPASTKVYAYYQYNTDGKLEKRQILMKLDTPPRLILNPETGIVSVQGGREARKDVDYEEIRDIQFLEDMRDPKSDGAGALPDLDEGGIRGPESVGATDASEASKAIDAKKKDAGKKSPLEGF